MRDYSKIVPAFWTQGSGKRLRGDPEAQVIALYLLTCPAANMIGLYYCPLPTIAHETGIPTEAVRGALARVTAAGFAYYDESADLVWVPGAALIQIGERLHRADKRRVAVLRELQRFSWHQFATDFFLHYATNFGLTRPDWLPPCAQCADERWICQDCGAPSCSVQGHDDILACAYCNRDGRADPFGRTTRNLPVAVVDQIVTAWKARREEALDRRGRRCELCRATSRLQVHHNTYERVGAELPDDLVVLCNACHARHHGKAE